MLISYFSVTWIEASSDQICKYCSRLWKPEWLRCLQGLLSHHSLSLCISCSYVHCWHWLGGAVLQLAALCLQIQIPRLPLQVCQPGVLLSWALGTATPLELCWLICRKYSSENAPLVSQIKSAEIRAFHGYCDFFSLAKAKIVELSFSPHCMLWNISVFRMISQLVYRLTNVFFPHFSFFHIHTSSLLILCENREDALKLPMFWDYFFKESNIVSWPLLYVWYRYLRCVC